MTLEQHSRRLNQQALLRGVIGLFLLIDFVLGIIVARDWDALRYYILPSGRTAVAVCLISWGRLLFFMIFSSNSWTFGLILPMLGCNATVLSIFCGVWCWGFYLSEYWMRIIDSGAPWSWFVAMISFSYFVSFMTLCKQPKMIIKSFLGPVITAPAFWLWIQFCAIKFDPSF